MDRRNGALEPQGKPMGHPAATLEDVEKHKFVLTPGRYVGVLDGVDDGVSFEEKMETLTGKLREQLAEESRLNAEIKKQLKKVRYGL